MKLTTVLLLAGGAAALYWFLSRQGVVPSISDLTYTGPRTATGEKASANCSPHSKAACQLLMKQSSYKGTIWDGSCCRVVKGGKAQKYA